MTVLHEARRPHACKPPNEDPFTPPQRWANGTVWLCDTCGSTWIIRDRPPTRGGIWVDPRHWVQESRFTSWRRRRKAAKHPDTLKDDPPQPPKRTLPPSAAIVAPRPHPKPSSIKRSNW